MHCSQMKKPRPREDRGFSCSKSPEKLCFWELTMYQLCGPGWEVTLALLALLTAVFPVAAGMLVGGLSGLAP